MQPDLLSTQREEEQPEAVSPQDLIPSESFAIPDAAQLEATPVAETVNSKPAPAAKKKRSKLNIVAIALAFLVFLLLLSFAWVGYWAYTLNNELAATQGELTAIQAEHAKLQSDYATLKGENEKLNADLTQARADLEKANTDLSTTQADLSKSKDQNKKLDAQIDAAGKLAEVLFVWTTMDNPSDIFKLDTLINETNNKELISQWNTFTRSPSDDALGEFMQYLILAIRNSLR